MDALNFAKKESEQSIKFVFCGDFVELQSKVKSSNNTTEWEVKFIRSVIFNSPFLNKKIILTEKQAKTFNGIIKKVNKVNL